LAEEIARQLSSPVLLHQRPRGLCRRGRKARPEGLKEEEVKCRFEGQKGPFEGLLRGEALELSKEG
jgi:hypothetical protein